MSNTNNRGKRNNGRSASQSRNNKGRGSSSNSRNRNPRTGQPAVVDEQVLSPLVAVITTLIISIVIFLSNIGVFGTVGDNISRVVFGLFGMPAYILPILAVVLVFTLYSVAEGSPVLRRVICSCGIYIAASILIELLNGVVLNDPENFLPKAIWENSSSERTGGGIIFGSIAFAMNKYLSKTGTVALLIMIILILIAVFLGRDVLSSMGDGSKRAIKEAGRNASALSQAAVERRRRAEEQEEGVYDDDLPRYARKKNGIGFGIGSDNGEETKQAEDNAPRINGEELPKIDKTPRINKKVSGVMTDARVGDTSSAINKAAHESDEIHEIFYPRDDDKDVTVEKAYAVSRSPYDEQADISFGRGGVEITEEEKPEDNEAKSPSVIGQKLTAPAPRNDKPVSSTTLSNSDLDMKKKITKARSSSKAYKMPPLSLLNGSPSSGKKGSNRDELLDIAKTLQTTLETFGVKAKVTDISQGPSVTRFELQPEVGVRVNKIVSLADDIKLSLAATDIRIEAPIPGKSAVGIEVPNKVSTGVGLRELLEDKAFKDFDSKIAFAVGKDIAGKTIVSDIAKMPHALIAGATGSGKSVCINTIIMSILYKAHPDEVKMIMIDPKVVELSVYNGIPHLMVPVVTDPKKAAAALNWGVAEMTERYKRFADLNVRDLKGYNEKIDGLIAKGQNTDEEGNELHRLPQIVIIVDELADLMMVAAKEVEESICRIAQLARACGIHLIIATQRPSVDVITGLIKANMPSRIAFAVSSGVDSRTILDMNGAEKLLGKGDMLFFPSGYPKPARIQGAFVSDAEVGRVVEFLKDQDYVGVNVADIENKITNMVSGAGSGESGGGDDIDDLFADAGRFIIAQDKASIGSLQRKFKIGFNRAARIMDQLAEAGVVSEENGTKPRDIMMSPEQFEQYVEEYI